jgi:hypothetical protein
MLFVESPVVTTEGERRASTRFPVTLPLQYRMTGRSGIGETANISSCGVLFRAQHELAAGMHLELAVDWPVLLDGSISLELCLLGTIVRVRGYHAGFEINKHLFRTTKHRSTALVQTQAYGEIG